MDTTAGQQCAELDDMDLQVIQGYQEEEEEARRRAEAEAETARQVQQAADWGMPLEGIVDMTGMFSTPMAFEPGLPPVGTPIEQPAVPVPCTAPETDDRAAEALVPARAKKQRAPKKIRAPDPDPDPGQVLPPISTGPEIDRPAAPRAPSHHHHRRARHTTGTPREALERACAARLIDATGSYGGATQAIFTEADGDACRLLAVCMNTKFSVGERAMLWHWVMDIRRGTGIVRSGTQSIRGYLERVPGAVAVFDGLFPPASVTTGLRHSEAALQAELESARAEIAWLKKQLPAETTTTNDGDAIAQLP